MSANFNMEAFMEDLRENLSYYLKDSYFPSEPVYAMLGELAQEHHADKDDIENLIGPAFRQLGLQGINVEEDDYLDTDATEEEIYSTLIAFLERHGMDTDAVYFTGVDEFSKTHADLFDKMVNIVFFTDENLPVGMGVIARTSYLLRKALQDSYIRRHPQEAERCLGWVDEETIDIIGPFLKDGRIPGWVYDEALRDLVADVGSYPLGQNIMELSMKAMDAQILFLSKDYWLPVGADEAAITAKLRALLTACNVDMERCFAEGVQIIPRDVLELARNIVFFGHAQSTSLYEAELTGSTLLSCLIQEEHARLHPDDRVTTDVVNRDMALALRTHAKDGYVPSFVIQREYNRLMALTHSAADTAAIRDGTMASLSLKSLILDEQLYLLPGASDEAIRRKALPVISGWNLDTIYESGAIPGEYAAEHNQLVAMIFFADSSVHDPQAANSVFWNILLPLIGRHRSAQGEAAPPQVLSEIETVCLQWQKCGLLPSFLRQAAVDTLLSYISRQWFAEYLYNDILERHGLDEIEVDGPDYLPPEEAHRLSEHIDTLIKTYGFDLDYIAQNSLVRQEEEPLMQRLANVLFFALPACATQQAAAAHAHKLLLDRAQGIRTTHHRRLRRL